MKKFSLIFLICMFWNSVSLANYKCSYNVWFKNGADNKLRQKIIKMSIDLSNDKQLKIFDHEIDLYYDNFIIVENNARYIHALSKSKNYLRSFTLNKKDKYSQWASLRNEGGTTVHHGYCK